MKKRPQVLSISFSDIQHDARVLRQLSVLAEFADVTTLGYGAAPLGATEHLEIPPHLPSLPQTVAGVAMLALRQFRAVELKAPAIAEANELLRGRNFDFVVANEARALPLAHAVADGAPVWGDMHEWAPEERSHVFVWRLLVAPFMRWACATYLPATDVVTTVNRSIAQLYDNQFGTSARVIRNSRTYCDLSPSPTEARLIRLVHSGAAVPDRGIETLIQATLRLGERFSLDLYLMRAKGQHKYWQSLQRLAGGSPLIRFHAAVTPEQLPETLNSYDVGVFVLQPATANHRFMLPNKFFDFVQARLALIFSPAVETDRLINEHELGLVTPGWTVEDLVATLQTLTPGSVAHYKRNADRAAFELSSRKDEAEQRSIVAETLSVD